MKRAFLVLLLSLAAATLAACGGCYEKARDVRVDGPSCVSVRASEQNGCGRALLIVDNRCNETLSLSGGTPGTRPQVVAAGAQATIDGYAAREGDREVMRGTVGSQAVVISWIEE